MNNSKRTSRLQTSMGTFSGLSNAITFQCAGTLAPGPSISESAPDSNGNVTVRCTASDGSEISSFDVYQVIGNSAGLIAVSNGLTCTIPEGTSNSKIFAICGTPEGGLSQYSNMLQLTAAPAFARAMYDPSVPGGQINLSWANTPNNETGFEIIRLIQQNRKTVEQAPRKAWCITATAAFITQAMNTCI